MTSIRLFVATGALIAATTFVHAVEHAQKTGAAPEGITASQIHIGGFTGGGVLTTYDDFLMLLDGGYALQSDHATSYGIQGAKPTHIFELDHAALIDPTGVREPIYLGKSEATVDSVEQTVSIAAAKSVVSQTFLRQTYSGIESDLKKATNTLSDPVTITCQLGYIFINNVGTNATSLCGPYVSYICTGGDGMKVVYYQSRHTCD